MGGQLLTELIKHSDKISILAEQTNNVIAVQYWFL